MWSGVFNPRLTKSITEHFDVINIQSDDLLDMYYVTVVFHKSPNQSYVFEIPGSRFKADKEAIGEEILRQLRA